MQTIRTTLFVLAVIVLVLAGGWQMSTQAQASDAPVLENRVKALETTVAALRKDHAALAAQVAQMASTPAPAKLLPTPTPKPTAAADDSLFEILKVDGRITESNDVWWKYAYIVELQNTSDRRLRLDATIEFLDADGFVVDDDRVYGFVLAAGETGSMTGYALIDAAVAANVEGINAKVRVAAAE